MNQRWAPWPLDLPSKLRQPLPPDPLDFTDLKQASSAKVKRVLVVDDDASTLSALRALLSACGYQVLTASTVASAINLIDDSIDGIVLDLMLPDGDGSDVLRCVRSAGLKISVCVTTGVSNQAWLDRVTALGADCILQKPIELSDLLEKL